ncbi:DNA methyltransferase family protein [Spirosoma pomorum]
MLGNPPYGGTAIADDVKTTLGLGSKDPYGAFISRFLGDGQRTTPLRKDGVLAFIVSDTFMTIKTHLPLRRQMSAHYLHKMVRVHPDTFSATVNTAIIFAQKCHTPPRQTPAPLRHPADGPALQTRVPGRQLSLDGRAQAVQTSLLSRADSPTTIGTDAGKPAHQVLMADLTNVSIHDHYERFLELLNETSLGDVAYGQATSPKLVSTPEYAIYQYPQYLITTNTNLPFFVASPKLFALMNDAGKQAVRKEVVLNGDTFQARIATMNNLSVDIIRFGDIADSPHGISTGGNKHYVRALPGTKGSYDCIESWMICPSEEMAQLTSKEKVEGMNKDWQTLTGCFVPFEKGGESDSSDGWMPNYNVPTPYYINWASGAIKDMKSNPGSAWKNERYFFRNGLTFSISGVYSPTFRLNSGGVFEAKGSGIFCDYYGNETLLAILSSRFAKYLFKTYIKHSVDTSGDDIAAFPFPYIDEREAQVRKIILLVQQIIRQQKVDPRYDYASNEQIEIDRLVYEAYGLNEADIQEVETWYARRYPKLAEAQRRNREKAIAVATTSTPTPVTE